jgi:hypothetical protein
MAPNAQNSANILVVKRFPLSGKLMVRHGGA